MKLFLKLLNCEIRKVLIYHKVDQWKIKELETEKWKWLNNDSLNDVYKVFFIDDDSLNSLLKVWRLYNDRI